MSTKYILMNTLIFYRCRKSALYIHQFNAYFNEYYISKNKVYKKGIIFARNLYVKLPVL